MVFFLRNYTKLQLPPESIKSLAICHQILCDSIDLLNSFFCLQVLFIFLVSVVFNTLCCFGIYNLARGNYKNQNELYFMIMNCIWALYHLYFIVGVVMFSSFVTKEGKSTRTFIQRLMDVLNDKTTSQMLSGFCVQINHCCIDISSGLFVYNWSILYLVNFYHFHLPKLKQFIFRFSRLISHI